MLHGLLWFPLLFFLVGLTIAGWNEYRKVETYRLWGQDFDQAKYDLYSVIGLGADRLTWGQPSRRGPENLQSLALNEIQTVTLDLDRRRFSLDELRQQPELADQRFKLIELMIQPAQPTSPAIAIRFTDLALACSWAKQISQRIEATPKV
jgi:hypothetical protein